MSTLLGLTEADTGWLLDATNQDAKAQRWELDRGLLPSWWTLHAVARLLAASPSVDSGRIPQDICLSDAIRQYLEVMRVVDTGGSMNHNFVEAKRHLAVMGVVAEDGRMNNDLVDALRGARSFVKKVDIAMRFLGAARVIAHITKYQPIGLLLFW